MSQPSYLRFDTLSLHAGQQPDPHTGARATPIYQTTSFVFRDTDHAAALFNMERAGHVYSRISNPTNAVLEERMAALEGGVGGDRHRQRPGGAAPRARDHRRRRLAHRLQPLALRRLAQSAARTRCRASASRPPSSNPRDLDAWRKAIRPNTRLLFGETLGNPGLDVLNVPAVARDRARAPSVPLLRGFDLHDAVPACGRSISAPTCSIHSATKFLGGHGIAIGGVLVDGGAFDWEASGKFPELTEPYDGFHGMDFQEESTVAAFCCARAARGCATSARAWRPTTAFQILQGIETLAAAHGSATSRTRARWSSSWPRIRRSSRSAIRSCPTHPDHALAKQLLPRGCGAVFTFSDQGRTPGRPHASSRRCACSRTSPTSATPSRW